MLVNNMGGYCDCGNTIVWKKNGICQKHTGIV